jgi:putative ABC transport system permease protein
MILNYFLLSFRNIMRQRGYALVNMFGLAVGLASALFILLYVKDELTFDITRIAWGTKFNSPMEI